MALVLSHEKKAVIECLLCALFSTENTMVNKTEASILCTCPNGTVIRLIERRQKPQAKNLGSVLNVRGTPHSTREQCGTQAGGAVFLGFRLWEGSLQLMTLT